MNRLSAGRIMAYSAGSFPKGAVHPAALAWLARHGDAETPFRSKSWDEFVTPDAPKLDIIITVCDNAAGEICPIFPGKQMKAHWGIADPAAIEGADQAAAFQKAADELTMRINALLAMPFEEMTAHDLTAALREIGHMKGATFV